MPLYEYRCKRCRSITAYMRPMDSRNEVATCSECGGPCARIISLPQRHKGVWQEPTDPEKLRTTDEIWR